MGCSVCSTVTEGSTKADIMAKRASKTHKKQARERAQDEVSLSVLGYDTQICGKLGTRMHGERRGL